MSFNKYEWEGVSSTSLSDAMAGLQTMDGAIKPLEKKMQTVGPAYTVQIVKNDCAVVFRALRDARPGEVLVIAAQGTCDVAFLGEIIATIAEKRGLAGIVIDGCIRDSLAIAQMGFPVFAKGAVPKSPAVNYLGKVQQNVECAGTVVRPGDIIFGDADGVVVIPQEQTAAVLAKAKAKEEKDRWKMNEVIPNAAALEAFLTKACGDDKVQVLSERKGDGNYDTRLA